MKDPQARAIAVLRGISRNESIKAYLLQNPPLYKIALRTAMRFIGGETLKECFATAKRITGKGHAFTIDFMGESTRDRKTARKATEEFLKVIKKIKKAKSKASISLDLSHIGLVINKKLGYENALLLAEETKKAGLEMMISMEGIDRTDDILEQYYKLSKTYNNVGITIQAYLYRTEKDIKKLLKYPGKIRLVKGAYETPKDQALPWGEQTDKAYRKHMEMILLNNHLCSLATHDIKLLEHAENFIKKHAINKNIVEFEMLHGVTPERLSQMYKKGYKTREYLPYGKEWYLYVCHRLAENPTNIYQALADAVG